MYLGFAAYVVFLPRAPSSNPPNPSLGIFVVLYVDDVGLTLRVGRHVEGGVAMLSDVLLGDTKSILFLGEPGRYH